MNNKNSNPIEDIKRYLESQSFPQKEQIESLVGEIEKQTKIHQKERNGLYNLFLVLLAVVVIACGYAMFKADENQALEATIERLERIDSLYNTFMEPRDGSISYRVDNSGHPISYRNLLSESDSIYNELFTLKNKLYDVEFELNLIKRTYPIKILHEGNKYRIESAQIDSALMLLHMYRDRLRYDSQQNCWYVSESKNK